MKQETALHILQTGANVFLTGEPGSGKTHTVNAYVRWLRSKGIEPAMTASTGIAATHIGGLTIHSWSGIGVRQNLTRSDLETIATNERIVKRMDRAAVLIIDEVSMLSCDVLDMVERVCRHVRRVDEPFGGLQIVLVGDFFQLPPIVRRDDFGGRQLGFDDEGDAPRAPFAYRARVWESSAMRVCYLSEQHRQEDLGFLKILSAIRSGGVDDDMRHTLNLHQNQKRSALQSDDVPRLYSHNIDVDRVNEKRLAGLPGTVHKFEMSGHGPDGYVAALKRSCLSPEVLSLKKGARVMFTKNNHDGSFVNGTLGEIEDFGTDGNPVVRTLNGRRIEAEPMEWSVNDGGKVLARITQIPLRLAWAMTIHKSQGMTLDAAAIDLSQAFEYGQGYVALSRVRTLAHLRLLGLNGRALEVHPDVIAQDSDFKQQSGVVEQEFAHMSEADHAIMVEKFILSSGGKLDGVQDVGAGLSRPIKKKKPAGASLDETLGLLQSGKSITEMAKTRGLAESTIFGHIGKLHAAGRIRRAEVEPLLSPELQKNLEDIHQAFRELGSDQLSPVFEKLRGAFSFDDLRLARMLIE